ncbi:MAG: Spy/CpxP family protein refolding chaperone [Bdellovibrionales bacterium]
MFRHKRYLFLGLVFMLSCGTALAQTPPQPQSGGVLSNRPPLATDPLLRLEGELAFLKTVLKITDAQSKNWDSLARSARESAKAMQAASVSPAPNGQQNVIETLSFREKLLKVHAENLSKVLGRLKPLYDSFDEEQKAAADQHILIRLSSAL